MAYSQAKWLWKLSELKQKATHFVYMEYILVKMFTL